MFRWNFSRSSRLCLLFSLGLLLMACPPLVDNECSVTGDCTQKLGSGWVCRSTDGRKLCVQGGKLCKSDAECRPTELCLNSQCTYVSYCKCKVNSDCSAGQKCVGCKCIANTTGTCSANSECSPSQECVNGRCVNKPKCQKDTECNRDEVCNNNVCVPNKTCGSDVECRHGEQCTQGRCTRKLDLGCGSDFDCSPDKPKCDLRDGRCVQCLTDIDCPPNSRCSNNQCSASPCACKTDADCPAGTRCDGCRCQSTEKGGPGSICRQAQECKDGHLCLQASDNTSYCFQDCSRDRDACSGNQDGRTSCLEVSRDRQGNPISLCLKVLKRGEKCQPVGTIQGICQPDGDLVCHPQKLTCETRVTNAKEGEPCDGQNILCDGSLKLYCDPNTRTCKKGDKFAKESELCDPTNSQGNGAIVCESGYSCLQFDREGNNRCIKLCNPSQSDSCAHNPKLKCLPLLSNGQGICLDNCSQDSDCAFKGYVCRQLQGNQKICFPPPLTGPVGFGGLCSTPVATKGCNTDPSKGGDPQFFCLRVQQGSDGYCSRVCNDNKCPEYTNSAGDKLIANCVAINQQGDKACLFPCGQPGQKCPDKLTCQNVGQQFCLAP